MQICLDMRTGAGCGTENPNHTYHCRQCSKPLRFALTLHDPNTNVGRYRIVRVIGYGAYGAVYEAYERHKSDTSPLTRFFSRYLLSKSKPDMRVALKETFDASSISSFAREFRVLSNLQHPNLPRYLDMFEAGGNGYLVMEYVPGQSLQDVLNRQTELLPSSQVLGYALQLCDVLEYLHSQDPPILHRDIKPANIRLTPEGRIKLVDFGLLKQAGYQTRATIRGLGTPAYAPLEQYGDEQQVTDVRSDIYSLGATLYHLLSGQEPLSAPNRLAGDDDPLPPLPVTRLEHVRQAVSKAMGLMTRERFVSISEFKETLTGVRQPEQPSPPQPPSPNTGRGGRKRERAVLLPLSPRETRQRLGGEGGAGMREDEVVSETPVQALAEVPSVKADVAVVKVTPWFLSNRRKPANYIEAVDDFSLPHLICETGGHVMRVRYSADGQYLVSITNEGHFDRWRVADGQLEVRHLLSGTKPLVSVAISPDGQTVAGVGDDLHVRVWRTSDGQLLHELDGHTQPIKALAYTPDGQILASTGEDKTIRFFNLERGDFLHLLSAKHELNCLKFSPTGYYLACGATGRLQLIRMIDGQWLPEIVQACYFGEENISWSFDEQFLMSGTNSQVYLWHLATKTVVKRFKGHKGHSRAVTFAPDGQTAASGGPDKTIRIWSFVEPYLQHFCRGHQKMIRCLAYAPNGQILASGSEDGTVRLWQLEKEVSQSVSRSAASQKLLKQPPPGLFSSSNVTIQLRQNKTKQFTPSNERDLPHLCCFVTGKISFLAFSADGKTIVSLTDKGEITTWRVADGTMLESYQLKTSNTLHSLTISPNGQLIASATDDLRISLWRLSDGQQLHQLRGHTGLVNALSFSPDGNLLASSSKSEQAARLWQVADGRLLHLLTDDSEIHNVSFSPVEHVLMTDSYSHSKLWDYRSGKLQQKIAHGSAHEHSVRWSPDGKMLAYGKHKHVNVVQKSNGKSAIRFSRHGNTVYSVAWHPSGQMLASSSVDKTIKLWSEKKSIRGYVCPGHHDIVTCLAFSPDGRILASGGKDGTMRLWQVPAV